MTETPNPIRKEATTSTRPPVKWAITVKESDTTVIVQFPIAQQETIVEKEIQMD